MRNGQAVREFSIERRLRERRVRGAEGADGFEVLAAIEELRDEIAELRARPPASGQASVAAELSDSPPDSKESLEVRVEIAQMVRMIGRAKLEIASIQHPMAEDDRMLAAAGELDAIVAATEPSTQDILAASERIESIIREIAGTYHADEDLVAMTDRVANETIRIFEACNVQDITGRRITKVIKILRYIEERIRSMINIWGAEALTEVSISGRETVEADKAPRNGPQLGNQGITRDEINARFDRAGRAVRGRIAGARRGPGAQRAFGFQRAARRSALAIRSSVMIPAMLSRLRKAASRDSPSG